METPPGSGGAKAARLPRWTRHEILVLIEAKRAVEGRGKGRGVAGGEPKWAAVSAYCRRRGVDRGPVQCRKRWSNLAGDFKKIKEWEKEGKEGFWGMRNDARRERRLPGFFDQEVFEVLERGERGERAAPAAGECDEEAVFDSGRAAGEDGLFSECEEEEEEEDRTAALSHEVAAPAPAETVVATPISEKTYEPSHQETNEAGMANDKQPATENPEKASSSRGGQKRRRTSPEEDGDADLQPQLIQVLEKNSRMLTAQLEAHNMNNQLDRDQRQHQANGLLGVLGKLADALGRIADKL